VKLKRTRENDLDRRVRADRENVLPARHFARELAKLVQRQSEVKALRAAKLRPHLLKQFFGARGVASNAAWPPLSRFKAGGGQADQRLEKLTRWAFSSTSMPQGLPRFVRLPVVAVVEQVNSA
jgi:hypothetical protein